MLTFVVAKNVIGEKTLNPAFAHALNNSGQYTPIPTSSAPAALYVYNRPHIAEGIYKVALPVYNGKHICIAPAEVVAEQGKEAWCEPYERFLEKRLSADAVILIPQVAVKAMNDTASFLYHHKCYEFAWQFVYYPYAVNLGFQVVREDLAAL